MRTTVRRTLALSAVCAAMMCTAAAPARAGIMDFLFGSKQPAAEKTGASKQRIWEVGEFTAVRLVEKEAGAPGNEHPVKLNADGLRAQLAAVQATVRGETQVLFGADELQELSPVLVQALAAAGPGDDVVLLSTSRRGGGFLSTPYGITARLFVKDGALQLIVHDARLDFVNAYRGTHIVPTFVFGSRDKVGADQLRSESAASKRSDWIALPLGGLSAAAAAPMLVPAAVAPAPAAPAAAAKPAAPAPAAAPAATAPRDAAFYEAQEQRLRGLKRLRDQNLITEEEYQQKRREIMQSL